MLSKTYSFEIDQESEETNVRYKGTFHMRRPTLNDLSAISASLSRMNQGQPIVSPSYEVLFTTIATIDVCGEKVPDWWVEVSEQSIDTRLVLTIGAALVKARNERLPFRPESATKEEASPQ